MTDVFIYVDHLQTFIREYRERKRNISTEVDDYIDTNCKSPLQEKTAVLKQEERRIIRSSFFSSSAQVYVCVWQL